ncbi:MAG: hypothetical protein R8L07_13575 [Alphaproteobacteria bacterium]|nr:hypothetical protein [Alphaproteobacteria bacterium]
MARKQAGPRSESGVSRDDTSPDDTPPDSTGLDLAADVARDCLNTAQSMQQAMLAAVAEQQRGHQEQLAETARLCLEILNGPGPEPER